MYCTYGPQREYEIQRQAYWIVNILSDKIFRSQEGGTYHYSGGDWEKRGLALSNSPRPEDFFRGLPYA